MHTGDVSMSQKVSSILSPRMPH